MRYALPVSLRLVQLREPSLSPALRQGKPLGKERTDDHV